MNDELREQLRRLDPMHSGVPVEPSTTPSSRTRLEQIMNTPLVDQSTSENSSESGAAVVSPRTRFGTHRRRNWMVVGSVAAAIVALTGALIIGNSGGDGGTKVASGPPLDLSLPAGNVLSSCIQFDVGILSGMSPAFAGTATAVEGETVTLTVDHWYTGGDAATVVLHGSGGLPALIEGFQFEQGQHYLITAADGNVNFCGYSGIATPDLTTAFDTAFGS